MFFFIIEKENTTKETSIRKDWINEDLVFFSNTSVGGLLDSILPEMFK